MPPALHDAIRSRTSVERFQPDRPIDDDTIATLVDLAVRAPSAYNLQNWRFIAARSDDARARLQSAAHGQRKVIEASVVFIVCGTLDAHLQLATTLLTSVESGIMEQRIVDNWVAQAHASHAVDAALRRDEAIRSASLAAMTLMLAAEGLGLGSCAMGGFDAAQVARAFGLAASELPVVLVAVGHPTSDSGPQKARKPLRDVMRIV